VRTRLERSHNSKLSRSAPVMLRCMLTRYAGLEPIRHTCSHLRYGHAFNTLGTAHMCEWYISDAVVTHMLYDGSLTA
jgi:hypothetical protein